MKRDKKTDELLIMRHFVEKFPDFPKGKLVSHESPDFILKVNKRKNINIELTEIFLPVSDTLQKTSEIIDQTKEAILKKNEKLKLYNAGKPFQNWLIIYCESLNITSGINLEEKFSSYCLDSKFDKTFLFDLFSGQVFDLSEK